MSCCRLHWLQQGQENKIAGLARQELSLLEQERREQEQQPLP